MNRRPIGIFDSGVGGLSVVGEVRRLMPNENVLYFADTAYCPYGPRPREQIVERCLTIANFFLDQGAKVLVVACNTASTAAVLTLRQRWPDVPIVGMVPAVKPAVAASRSGFIGVLATEATRSSSPLRAVLHEFAREVKVTVFSPPGLVEAVERGEGNSRKAAAILEGELGPSVDAGMDTLVLGCTHFPFLTGAVRKVFGDKLNVLDSGLAVARQCERLVNLSGRAAVEQVACVTGYTSADGDQFQEVCERLGHTFDVLHERVDPLPPAYDVA